MGTDTTTISSHLLSTRPLSAATVQAAQTQGVAITTLSFIETQPVQSVDTLHEIEQSLYLNTTVVFTSMNAVEAVAAVMLDHRPNWQIYCIGHTTRQLVEQYFPEDAIVGTANNAVALADKIIEDELADEVHFFCGNIHRPELVDMLFAAGILVTEVIVYETIPQQHQLSREYDGVLFFSPSAVESFFTINKLSPSTVVFAIGQTTADAVRTHCSNKIIIASQPGKEALAQKAVEVLSKHHP